MNVTMQEDEDPEKAAVAAAKDPEQAVDLAAVDYLEAVSQYLQGPQAPAVDPEQEAAAAAALLQALWDEPCVRLHCCYESDCTLIMRHACLELLAPVVRGAMPGAACYTASIASRLRMGGPEILCGVM